MSGQNIKPSALNRAQLKSYLIVATKAPLFKPTQKSFTFPQSKVLDNCIKILII